MITKLATVLISVILLAIFSSCAQQEKVDLVIHHAKIYTIDSVFSVAEAMAVDDGKIVATGNTSDILKKYTGENVIDAAGQTIVPGFIDAHCHFTGFATDMWKCTVTGTTSFNQIIEKIKVSVKQHPCTGYMVAVGTKMIGK